MCICVYVKKPWSALEHRLRAPSWAGAEVHGDHLTSAERAESSAPWRRTPAAALGPGSSAAPGRWGAGAGGGRFLGWCPPCFLFSVGGAENKARGKHFLLLVFGVMPPRVFCWGQKQRRRKNNFLVFVPWVGGGALLVFLLFGGGGLKGNQEENHVLGGPLQKASPRRVTCFWEPCQFFGVKTADNRIERAPA